MFKNLKFLQISILILTILFSKIFFAFSQEEIDIGEIVVTATKTEKPVKETPQTVAVITKEDIEKLENKNLGDVLRDVSGVNIKSNGALGALSTLTIRGLTERQILVLLDGVPIKNKQSSWVDLSDFSLQNVEKIEILKGAASSLYGADALGGVVNIITKKPQKITEFKISTGANNTRKYAGIYGIKIKKFGSLISFERQESDGIRENSDYKADSLNIKLDYRDNYILIYNKYKGEKGVPGSLSSPSKFARQWDDNEYYSLMLRKKFSENQELNLKLYKEKTNLKYFNGSTTDRHKNITDGLELQDNFRLNSKNLIVAGCELQNFKNDSTQTGNHKLKNSAYYLQLENKNLKNTIVNLGIRQDDHKTYGKKSSPRLSLVYNLDEKTICRFVFGKAFASPTFNDLYWPASVWAEGNPNLKPEKGENFEFATEYREEGLLVKISFFKNDVEDLINWVPFPDGKWRPSNVDKAEITGSEIELLNKINKNISANFNLTLLDAVDTKNDRKLVYRPDVRFNYGLRYTDNKINFAIQGRYTDKRVYKYDWMTGAPKYLPSYTVYDAKLSRDFDRFNFSISVKNIFDKKYQETYDYPMPGREWFVETIYRL